MRPTILLLALLLCLIARISPAADSLTFDLTNPEEAAKWILSNHDDSQGPGGFHDGCYRVATTAGASPAYMERRVVDFDASRYNRVLVDMKVTSKQASGVVGAGFFFSKSGTVDPQSMIPRSTPFGQRQLLDFDLDQSLLWQGNISLIRLDPVWGGGVAEIYGIRFEKAPPMKGAPCWDFSRPEDQIGWAFGEFDSAQNGRFVPREVTTTADGAAFEVQGIDPSLQRTNLSIPARMVDSVDLEVRNLTGANTQLRFFWGTRDNELISPERALFHPITSGNEFQQIHLDLRSHPMWTGTVSALIINPIKTAGKMQIRRIAFHGVEGLGEIGHSDSLVAWRSHQEVNEELKAGNYKPLLVLLTLAGSNYSKKVELELASNSEFVSLAKNFHAVRLDVNDPASSKILENIVRIPVLVTMEYDFRTKQWVTRDKLAGPEVTTGGLGIMRKVATRAS